MHPDVVTAERGGQLTSGRLEREVRALVERGPESLGTELLGQVAHAGQAAVLPVAELAEDLGHTPAELDRLVGPDEDVDVRSHALAVGEPPPISTLKPTVPSACSAGHRPMSLISTRAQSSVQPVTAILNLRGRLAYSRLPVKNAEMACATGQASTTSFASMPDTGHEHTLRAESPHAWTVVKPDVPEALPDAGDVGDADPVELDVLPRREVGVAVPEDRAVVGSLGEGVGRHADLADLGRGHHPAGDLDPHHEGVAALALRVHPDPLEALLLSRHLGDGVGALLGVRVDDGLGHLEGVPRQLQLLDGVELADVAIGPDELEPAVAPAAELHPVGIVEVTRH